MSYLSTIRLPIQAQPPHQRDVWCVDHRDAKYLFHQIFELDSYSGHGIRLDDDDVIIDVGANIGLFLLRVAQHLQRMTYYAVEPIPRIFEALTKNAAGVGQKVHCLPLGLADREGEVAFAYMPRTPCCSTMYPADRGEDYARALLFTEQMIHQSVRPWLSRLIHWMPKASQRWLVSWVEAYYGRSRQVTCTVKTLSQVIDEQKIDRINLLKIDAERAELDILRGIEPRHWPMIRQMILEVHYPDGDRFDQLVEIIERNGFHIECEHNPTNDSSRMFFLKRQ